jgi:hypothetical protein
VSIVDLLLQLENLAILIVILAGLSANHVVKKVAR